MKRKYRGSTFLQRMHRWKGGSGNAFDPAAITFFTQAGSMSYLWSVAYNNLFQRARARIGISKIKYLTCYKAPDSTTANINLFNPSVSATPVNSPTWDYQGYKFNGTNQYVNLNYKPVVSGTFTTTNCAFGGWATLNTAANQCFIGARNGTAGTSLGIFLNPRNASNIYNYSANTNLSTTGTNTDSIGMWTVYRTDNTTQKINLNGVDVTSDTDAANAFLDLNLFAGASNNNGTPGNYTANQLMFNFVCDGDVNFATLYDILSQFQIEANEAITDELMTAYVAALAAQSGSLSSTEYTAKRALYKFILDNNYYSDILDFGVVLGGNLNASLVKSKYPSGVSSSLANTNFVLGDYSNTLGINVSSNTNKLLQTGITPTSQGLSKDNITAMVYRTTEPVVTNNSFMMGLNNASGETELKLGYDVGMISNTGRSPICVGMLGLTSTGTCSSYFDRTQVIDDFSAPTAAYNTELTLFKAKKTGTDRYTAGGLGFYLIGKGMTKARYMALTQAVYVFLETIGRRSALADFVICGDSVTLGSNSTDPIYRYSKLLAASAGLNEANFGLQGTRTRDIGTPARDLPERYTELLNYKIGPNYPTGRVHLQFGINDMTLDGAANGTQATANACRDVYNTVIDYLFNTVGMSPNNISIGTPNYTTEHNDTKRAMYCASFRESAVTKGVLYKNNNQAMIDAGDPGSMLDDTVHLNNIGHAFVAASNATATHVS